MQKIAIGQEDHYTTSYTLDSNYFKEYYEIIAIDLTKQHALYADRKAMQQINVTENLQEQETD